MAISSSLHTAFISGHHARAMTCFFLVRLVVLVSVIAAYGRAADTPLAQRLERIAETAAARQGFMGAVLVARDGTTLLDRAYGSASLELEVPNTPAMRFRIGSITKQFTAAAILLLEERGKLRLADPVTRHVPEVPAAWAGITLYQLLTHTSGIHNLTSLPEFPTWKMLPQTPLQAIDRLRDLPLDFAPGEKFAYSNSNYLVLGLVVERASGQDYTAFLHTHILGPLGLRNTDVDNTVDVMPRRAVGHLWFLGTYYNAPYIDLSVPHGAGAMYSTTHDLRHWIEGLLAGKLFSPASVTRMITPEKNSYALGVRVITDGRRSIQHGGSIAGFSAFLSHFPDENATIVVLANVSGGVSGSLARDLARALFDDGSTL
jgi:CubicO group peptidase (beta-lactamase class C family)